MVWLGARARCFHNEVRLYLPTQYVKIEFSTFCQIIAAPPSGFREGISGQFRRGMFHICAKRFILVRHIYWIFRLLCGGWLRCTCAFVKWHLWPYLLKLPLWSTATTHPHCHCTPRHPPARALARLVSSSQGMGGLAWYGMVWLGVRARCFHNEVR